MITLIFDFDGTIADSFATVLTIANRLAAEFGFPHTSPDQVNELQHLSSREIVRRSGVSVIRLPFLLRRLRSELNQEIAHLRPIEAMPEVLWSLRLQGYRLGIVTSNSKENVTAFLAGQGLDDAFDFIDSELTLFGKGRVIRRALRQHRLQPSEVVYIGDETRDIEAARNVGIPVIAVSWGFNSAQALAAEQPDALIGHPHELLERFPPQMALPPITEQPTYSTCTP